MFSETFAEAWQARYGEEPGTITDALAPFLRHRSVRAYADKPVDVSLISHLIGAAQSAATSSNLQLWSVISVQDPERRQSLAELCADQKQIKTAPWFFAFFADHYRLRKAAQEVGENAEGLDYAEFFIMACIDAALAAERFVCAAESVGLGICYIGALRNQPAEVAKLLNLPSGVFGAFGLCLGYPDESRPTEIKPRLDQDAIWFRETYDQNATTEAYDERMRAFYESQSMKGDATWRMRSGRRADNDHLSGREVLREWLAERGFNRR